MAIENILGFDKNASIMHVFMEKSQRYSPALQLAQNILREEGSLPKSDREIIAMHTSSLNGCKFCTGSHKVFAQSLGAEELDLDNILNKNYAGHKLETILNFVTKLTLNPSSIERKDYEDILNAGFSNEDIKDAVAVCAAFNFFNRIVEGHGIVNDNVDEWQSSASMINIYGYDQRYM